MSDVSCAGHLSAGETSQQAAIAELNEELGLHAHIVNDNRDMTAEQIIQHIKTEHSDTTALYHLCRLPREQLSQQGKFIDREHTDVYVALTDRTVQQYTLQPEEVDAVQYIDVDEFIRLQHSPERCEQLQYVPISNFELYYKRAFSVIKQLQQYIVSQKHDQKNSDT